METVNGISTGETGFTGKTLFPDKDGMQNSPSDNIVVIVHNKLSPMGAAEMYSHEANGHGLLYIRNGWRSCWSISQCYKFGWKTYGNK